MKITVRLLSIALFILVAACSSSQKSDSGSDLVRVLTFNDTVLNLPELRSRPYVVMVSIDGYRADYNAIFQPKNLLGLERDGVAAKSLKPVYPSKTFPNHYSMATGLYANRHGIVSNEFMDPATKKIFALKDRTAVEDGSWYGGTPLWTAVQKQGLRTATFFWVGSEAEIGGRRPNYYLRYSDEVPNADRVSQVLDWLALPEAERPHLIMLYFSLVDSAGHRFGTRSDELRNAVLEVDEQIGRLRSGFEKMGLPINLIVTSDHGMLDLDSSKVLILDQSKELEDMFSKFHVMGRGPQMQLYLKAGENVKTIRQMEKTLETFSNSKGGVFRVRRGAELNALNYGGNKRAGDLVIEPELPWLVGLKSSPPDTSGGNHGWDPKSPLMHGIFLAVGPSFRNRAPLPTVENVDVFPLVLEVLRLKPVPGIDGSLIRTQSALAQ
ncbi:MAG: ectonucleotide pyrophosphatase/phosphodiesterase [Bdellovibrionota bacterium]